MSTRNIATHAATLVLGVALGTFAFRAAPTPTSTPGADNPPPQAQAAGRPPLAAQPGPAGASTAQAPDAPPAATATLPHAELQRRYAIVRDLAQKNTALSLDFDDQAFTLYPATTEFFGLTEQQSAAVQHALDATVDASRELEIANTEVIVEGKSIAIGDLSPHTPALEKQLRENLASIKTRS